MAVNSALLDLSEHIHVVGFSSLEDVHLKFAIVSRAARLGDESDLVSLCIEDADLGHAARKHAAGAESEASLCRVGVPTRLGENLGLVASGAGHAALLTGVVVFLDNSAFLFAGVGVHHVFVGVGAEGQGGTHQTLAMVHLLFHCDEFAHLDLNDDIKFNYYPMNLLSQLYF